MDVSGEPCCGGVYKGEKRERERASPPPPHSPPLGNQAQTETGTLFQFHPKSWLREASTHPLGGSDGRAPMPLLTCEGDSCHENKQGVMCCTGLIALIIMITFSALVSVLKKQKRRDGERRGSPACCVSSYEKLLLGVSSLPAQTLTPPFVGFNSSFVSCTILRLSPANHSSS